MENSLKGFRVVVSREINLRKELGERQSFLCNTGVILKALCILGDSVSLNYSPGLPNFLCINGLYMYKFSLSLPYIAPPPIVISLSASLLREY